MSKRSSRQNYFEQLVKPRGVPTFVLATALIPFLFEQTLEAFVGSDAVPLVTIMATIVALYILHPVIKDWLYRWFRKKATDPDIEVTRRELIEDPDALVVIVSKPYSQPKSAKSKPVEPEEPAYETAINRFYFDRTDDIKRLKWVFLVHSNQSKDEAKEFKQRHEDVQALEIETDGLCTDYMDLDRCRETFAEAIQRAKSRQGVERVVVDITGGTKTATLAATAAGLEAGVELSYIQPPEKGPLKNGTIIGIDVRAIYPSHL